MSLRETLPRYGFGAAQIGNLYHETTDDEALAAVDEAWHLGLRYFDTAPHYGLGLSERRLGRVLRGRPRNEYLVSTKVGRVLEPSPHTAHLRDESFDVPADHVRAWDFSRDGIRRSLEASLQRLGLDRVDIAYLHDPDDHWSDASTTAIEALGELRAEGVVGAIGAGMNQGSMLAEFVRTGAMDVVMLAGRFTLLEQSALDDLLPVALQYGVPVVAAGVYNSGLLSRARVPEAARYDYADASAETIARARTIARVCAGFGVTLPEVALQFPLRHTAVASVVVGMRNADQVSETIRRATTDIPDELWSELERAGLITTGGRE